MIRTTKEARRVRVAQLRGLQEMHAAATSDEERAEIATIIGQQMRFSDADLVRAAAREAVECNAERRLLAALAATAPPPTT